MIGVTVQDSAFRPPQRKRAPLLRHANIGRNPYFHEHMTMWRQKSYKNANSTKYPKVLQKYYESDLGFQTSN
jgi:hypothetical protein